MNPTKIQEKEEKSGKCTICMDSEINNMKKLHCNHIFCTNCIASYIEDKILNGKIKIQCPSKGCIELLKHSQIEDLINKELLTKYDELLIRKGINRDPNIQFCPKPGSIKKFNPISGEPFTTCVCGIKICNICCQEFHPNKTCLKVVDIKFQKFAQDNQTRFCMMCKSYVHRVSGCDHITCPICGYEFCWKSGKAFHPSNSCIGTWNTEPPNTLIQFVAALFIVILIELFFFSCSSQNNLRIFLDSELY